MIKYSANIKNVHVKLHTNKPFNTPGHLLIFYIICIMYLMIFN